MCVCVCLSVSVSLFLSLCPSHFLSTRLQVRPLNGFLRIFIHHKNVDSLKDADLRKDVPYGGSRWWIITFRGPKSPKTPILGAWIGISSQICELSSDMCIRLTWNLTGTSWVVSYGGKTIPSWRTAAILKIDISPYLSVKSSDFHDVIKKWKSCIGQTPSSTERISCSKTTTLLIMTLLTS